MIRPKNSLLCALPCWRLWQNCHFRHICQIRQHFLFFAIFGCCVHFWTYLRWLRWFVMTESRNDPQRPTTIHNDPQLPTTISKRPTTIQQQKKPPKKTNTKGLVVGIYIRPYIRLISGSLHFITRNKSIEHHILILFPFVLWLHQKRKYGTIGYRVTNKVICHE